MDARLSIRLLGWVIFLGFATAAHAQAPRQGATNPQAGRQVQPGGAGGQRQLNQGQPGARQPGARQPGARQPGAQQGVPQQAVPMAPKWLPLAPAHAKFVYDILGHWEAESNKIKRYRCEFQRWEYDPVFGPGENTFKTYAKGVIKYSSPDKGMYKIEDLRHFKKDPMTGKATYEKRGDMLEHWVCDGKSVFEFDYQKRQLIETELPAEMRGKAIAEGPLPFLFGAQRDDIQKRYWIRVITPEEKKKNNAEYWLEAIPKTQRDAVNFRAVHIMIDGKDFLPKGMVLFSRGQSRLTFAFDDREVNFNILHQQLNIFHREFFKPDTPSGWQKVTHNAHTAALPK